MPARLEVRVLPDRVVVAERKRGVRLALLGATAFALFVAAFLTLMERRIRERPAGVVALLGCVAGAPLGLVAAIGAAPRRTLELDRIRGEFRYRFTWMGVALRSRSLEARDCRSIELRQDRARIEPPLPAGTGLLLHLFGPAGAVVALASEACRREAVFSIVLDTGEPEPWITLRTRWAGDGRRAVEALRRGLSEGR